jgi:predicted nucleotidyltransferase
MVSHHPSTLLASLTHWINQEKAIRSAVLFGSHVRPQTHTAAADALSDIDLHLVVDSPKKILTLDWGSTFPELTLNLKFDRSATGGVAKLSLSFSNGEADLVLVPTYRMRTAHFFMRLRIQKRFSKLDSALNALATVMSGGYQFLKGEDKWGQFFRTIVENQPGFRVSDSQAHRMAEDYIYDMLWVMKKLKRGELIAAQRILHRSLLETNVTLLHELRIRQGKLTFQQARRVELLLSPIELNAIRVNSPLESTSLRQAVRQSFDGLQLIMRGLVPDWKITDRVALLISQELEPNVR